MAPYVVQYFKYGQTLHWRHELVRLGTDEHGTWLGAPMGTILQRGSEPVIIHDRPFVQLLRDGAWWTALFNSELSDIDVYVDVITPAVIGPDRAEMVDLDLDIIRRRDGTVYVDDEDEFIEHARTLEYPPAMMASARATAAELVLAVERGDEPFANAWRPWLERVLTPTT